MERKGWLDDTWIVITSDHGEAFLEHGTYSHHQLYAEELHVPLIIRPPGGLERGEVVKQVVGLMDVPATLLDIAGIGKPPMVQGSSVFPTGSIAARPVHSTNNEAQHAHALTAETHKLLQRTGHAGDSLFDRNTDPGERDDLLLGGAVEASADAPTDALRQALADALRAEADRWRAEAQALRDRLGEPVQAGALDPAQLETLRALGYVK